MLSVASFPTPDRPVLINTVCMAQLIAEGSSKLASVRLIGVGAFGSEADRCFSRSPPVEEEGAVLLPAGAAEVAPLPHLRKRKRRRRRRRFVV